MYVCHCRAVNERSVARTIDHGADTVEEIGERCGACTCCQACRPELERLLSERAQRLAGAGASHGLLTAFRGRRHG